MKAALVIQIAIYVAFCKYVSFDTLFQPSVLPQHHFNSTSQCLPTFLPSSKFVFCRNASGIIAVRTFALLHSLNGGIILVPCFIVLGIDSVLCAFLPSIISLTVISPLHSQALPHTAVTALYLVLQKAALIMRIDRADRLQVSVDYGGSDEFHATLL